MPTPTPTVNAVAYVADAQNALSRGDYAAALTAYNTIAKLEPGNPEPWITMSRLHMIEQDIQGAFDTATQAVKLDEKNPAALATLARAEDWLGDFESALNHALDALDIDPQNVETMAVLAEIYTDVGNYDIAQGYLDQALAIDANHVLALRNQAYLHEKLGKYDDAIAELDHALAQDPQPRRSLYGKGAHLPHRPSRLRQGHRGLSCRRRRQQDARDARRPGRRPLQCRRSYSRPCRVLREAVELNPDYGPALVHLGMALYARRNYEDAVTNLEKGLALIGDQAREEHLYHRRARPYLQGARECDFG